GLLDTLGQGHELRVVAPEEVAGAITEEVAAMLLTEVDYRTGRLHDMAALTRAAHDAGALAIWDLAHSAGAMPVDVTRADADFAVGCTYKYLNGGPGAPAFIHVAPRHAGVARPALAGWMGHEAPFAFDAAYRPGAGIERMRVGTPPVIALAALEAALDVWDMVDMRDVRAASLRLSERFIAEVEAQCPSLELASPREATRRGSQVSFRHPHAYPVMAALIDRGATEVSAYISHGVLSGPAVDRVANGPLKELVITDSIEQPDEVLNCSKIRRVPVAPLMGEAIRRIANEESVSKLFD
ncbi:hypothetical protein LTR94_026412, partial [Friedmanniomyces endolithicus]